jgi:hypothetical protein
MISVDAVEMTSTRNEPPNPQPEVGLSTEKLSVGVAASSWSES